MQQDLIGYDATALAAMIASGEVTAVEVVQAHLERIGAVDGALNVMVTVTGGQALDAARAVRSGPRSSGPPRSLARVLFTVKDPFETAGVRTTRGSRMFADQVPQADATAATRLRGAGGLLLAKTNLPEVSCWTETDNPLCGRTLSPWAPGSPPAAPAAGSPPASGPVSAPGAGRA